MSDLDDLSFACEKVISVKEEVEICETQLLEQIFDGFEVTHVDPCVKIQKEIGVVNEIFHTEDNQTELNDCEGIREQPYECYLRPDDSTSSARKHQDIRPFLKNNHTCSICEKSFRVSSRLKQHMNVHTGSQPYACTICPRKYASVNALREHILTHGSGFKCTFCEKSYKSRSGMIMHIKIHNNTHKKFECTLCNLKCGDSSKRRIHEKTHTNNRMNYQCEKCKLYFRLEDQHRSHLEDNKCKGYASEKPFQCSECDNQSFISVELLNLHKVEFHPPPIKNHICLICTKTYKYKYLLNLHMNSHTGSRPYPCPICPKRFSCPDNLLRHKKTHKLSADGKIRGRFKCTLCEKSFRSKTNLNSHMHFHRGERPFKCEICPKSFTHPDSLRTHIKNHSGERKYECTLCNKIYTRNSDLRVHKKSHTNSRMNYQCEKCKMYFRSKNQYGSHLKDNKCKGYALDKPFQCSKGDNESFATVKNLIRHKAKDKCNRNCQECDHIRENKKCETQVQNEIKNIENDEQSQENDAFEKKYKCDECKKEFICKRNLNFHLISHLQIA